MADEATKMIVTVKEYLTGAVGNIPVSDSTLKVCLHNADALTYEEIVDNVPKLSYTSFDMDVDLLSERQRDLSLAWLYATVAGYTAQSGTVTDRDADWEHSEGSFRVTDKLRALYKQYADELFAKWDEPLLFSDNWGFVGRGISNPRNYRV